MDERIETTTDELERLRRRLTKLREKLVVGETRFAISRGSHPGRNYESARNLIHYLGLRSEDLRPLQAKLTARGLSSLGRAESHVLGSVEAVLAILARFAPGAAGADPDHSHPLSREDGAAILAERSTGLFGPTPEGRSVRIMVTAPDEATHDYPLMRDLLANGMNCLRINCAHGDPATWKRMIDNLRRAQRELGRPCTVVMELAGPRARTGTIEPGPPVMKVKPRRDALGWVTRPAEVWLTGEENPAEPPTPADAIVPLPATFVARLAPGDRLRFDDARDARRTLTVITRTERGCWARLKDTAYITSGTRVEHRPAGDGKQGREKARIGAIAPEPQRIPLKAGDRLILTRDPTPGRLAVLDDDGNVKEPARIPCTPPEVLLDLHADERIWFNEGRIGGRIASTAEGQVLVSIDVTAPGGAFLAAGHGINLPESDLRLPSLTAKDIATLPFIFEHADLVGYSFIRTAADLEELYRRLDDQPGRQPGVLLKIETRKAFEELPAILLNALRRPSVGIMIARGDLAVECGFERLAEVQEEILWFCEAAHLPVIWATQVLEGLAKRGLASRAEITDAAVGVRAECVMLNKGPFIVETLQALNSILERMQAHQQKKQSLLRHLRVVDTSINQIEEDGSQGHTEKRSHGAHLTTSETAG